MSIKACNKHTASTRNMDSVWRILRLYEGYLPIERVCFQVVSIGAFFLLFFHSFHPHAYSTHSTKIRYFISRHGPVNILNFFPVVGCCDSECIAPALTAHKSMLLRKCITRVSSIYILMLHTPCHTRCIVSVKRWDIEGSGQTCGLIALSQLVQSFSREWCAELQQPASRNIFQSIARTVETFARMSHIQYDANTQHQV